jgi:hypothetical protein
LFDSAKAKVDKNNPVKAAQHIRRVVVPSAVSLAGE